MSNMPHIPSQEELGERLKTALGRGFARQERMVREAETLSAETKRERQKELERVMATLPLRFEEAAEKRNKDILVCSTYRRHATPGNECYIHGAFERAQPLDKGAIKVEFPGHGKYWEQENGGAYVTLSEESQILWDYLTRLAYDPKIRYAHDGGGMDSWYEMYVSSPVK